MALPKPSPDVTPALTRGSGPADVVDGKYRLTRLVNSGGMGSVWEAQHVMLDMSVAIKMLPMAADENDAGTLSERLFDEARALAKLKHPAIVSVMDVGRMPDGATYIVMELLEGESLACTLQQRGRIEAAKAVRCALPIAHAMHFAHEQGMLHRDVKPDNIMLCQIGQARIQPKLIDFGLARAPLADGGAAPEGASHGARRSATPDRTGNRPRTGAGQLVGSPHYMAPEQFLGESARAETDIWSFSVVLYELIAGAPPFDGTTFWALANAICNERPPPLAAVDPELWAIIERGLEKRPSDRWNGFRSLGEALASWLLSNGVSEDITGARISETWSHTSAKRDPFDSDPPPDDVWMHIVREARNERVKGGPRPAPTRPSTPRPAESLRAKPEPADDDQVCATATTIPPAAPNDGAAPVREAAPPEGTGDAPVSRPVSNAVSGALAQARTEWEAGDLAEAYSYVNMALEAAGGEDEQILASHWSTIKPIFAACIGDWGSVIRTRRRDPTVALSALETLVASRAGGLSIAQALEVVDVDPRKAVWLICRLLEKRVIAVEP